MPHYDDRGAQVEVTWAPTADEDVHDLLIDGRIAEYDVPLWEREEALDRARVVERP